MRRPRSGGGWKAIGYSMKLARRVGFLNMWRAMRSKNTCKTCAVGMGGQLGGMVNEGGHFPEVCKKSFQAMASDMQGALRTDVIEKLSLNQLRAMTSRQLEMSGRISEPLYMAKGASSYKVTTWDHAISTLVERMQAAGPERSFFYASGRASNEAGFLFQMLARLFGTNYVNNCSYYCHQASGVGLGMAIGTGAGTVRLEDLQHTDLYILVGANPSSNHPRLMRSLMEMRRNGGRIIVVNPMRELGLENFRVPSDVRSLLFGTQIASQYVQPHIGGDLALLTGIAKDVIERSGHDKKFIAEHTEGFEDFLQTVQATSWNEIVTQSGVDRDTIRGIADQYVNAKNVVIAWCMGITHHLHGTRNVHAIANLALLRGMVGRAHAGVMPIRGHSNVQGLGTVGVTPVLKQNMLERFEKQLGIKPPTSPGFDTMACMDAAHAGSMDFALCLGGNLYGSNPNSKRAFDAIRKLKTLVYFSTTLNTGHAWGTGEETFILPVLPRDEEQQATTQESMFSYVRLSDGGPTRHRNVRSEVSILAEIGRQIFPNDKRLDWSKMQSHAAIRELIADLIPGYEELKSIDATKQEFHVPGRSVDHYQFPTASGKAKFHATQLPEQNLSPGQLRLMTMRSEGQFNSVVYDEEDLYRGQERRDVILMNAADIKQLGLHPEQRIKIKSDTGEMRYILVREFDIRAGNVAMYYPESNVLIPSTVDPLSKTPAFKSIAVTITAETDV
ncbi:MAG: FdhF/YdeP family oxidoreductase [Planctomycetales bacterium]|nr:FdhF/YdeP family oxidoreductase [Planctomycetales bacterium]